MEKTLKHLNYLSPKSCKTFCKSIDDILCEVEWVRKGKKGKVANVCAVFDIEATSFYVEERKQCCMYAWVFGLNGRCIRGRTWGEFLDVVDELVEAYNLSLENRLIVYVHNLAYEFQWFKHYFEWENVFSVDARKPLYAVTKNGIEFRCSYLLSGYSLGKLGENLTKYKVEKKVGDLDYNLMRHSKTPLTEKEWGYILNDGLVVMAYIQEEIERLGRINKLPLTKTGYVRNLCREKCLKGSDRFWFTKLIKSLTLTPETYQLLKRGYTGGFTHANVNYVDQLLTDVHSFDFTSSYPAVIVSEMFPMSKPQKIEIKNEDDFIQNLKSFCCLFTCVFHNIRPTVNFENYISLSRCLRAEHYIINNGRIVEADLVEITLTEQDFIIISQMYEWDEIEIYDFYRFDAFYLPKDFVLTTLELYKDKTELKGVEGKEVEYLVSKGMINSMYGMCVTDPCKDENLFNGREWQVNKADIVSLIDEYNNNKQRFLYYAWGVWVTAYARRNLFSGILEFREDYIYSDTDSIKVVNIDKHKQYIEDYNKKVTEKIARCLEYHDIPLSMASPKTIKGVPKPLGVWDYEGKYDKFKTLGAKRYMTETDGEISITIAGVSKKAGVEYLKHTYKTPENIFANFTEDLHFPAHYDKDGVDENGSGKLCHTYIDTYMDGELIDYMGIKHIYNEQSGVHMENTDFTLGLEDSFVKLILGVKEGHLI